MSTLLKNVTNCIWHAFDSLQNKDVVHKSKLKVLTANIGTLLDLYGVEKGLDHFRSSQELTFDEFRYYLQHEVFSSLPKTTTLPIVREYEKKISEVCWLVCRKSLLGRDPGLFGDDSVFKLFRIFCLLGDLVQDADDSKHYVVVLQPSEAGIIAEQLVHCLGLRWDTADWEALGSSIGHFKWAAFLAVLEAKYCGDQQLHSAALVEAVDEIYDVFIEDIIKKGYLFKRGYLLPTMREYWCVLQPCALTYYKSSSQKDQCGRVVIDEYCSVEAAIGEGKIQRFQLITPDRTFEFGTQDHKSRLQWISALRQAAAVSGGVEGYQRRARAVRRGAGARREREVRETRARLQHEVKARLAAEAQAQELVELAQQDNKKLEELKHAQVELEKLLHEETQAKRDEEIVRALQARVLAEEWERREELERLQEEQNKMLEEERLKRQQFEMLQAEKETQFKEAEKRLKELEEEKQRLDAELKAAQHKISKTEHTAHALQVQLRDLNPVLRNGERARRAISFIPTTKSSSDTLIDVRAIRHLKILDDEEKL